MFLEALEIWLTKWRTTRPAFNLSNETQFLLIRSCLPASWIIQHIFAEDYEEACTELGCNITELTYKELSNLVKKRSISFSPKNNVNNPRREFLAEQLKELEEVWQSYKTLRPGCSHDQSSGSEGECIDGGGGRIHMLIILPIRRDFLNIFKKTVRLS
ncbi:large T antigen [Caerostris extrusa]|uniref:Large T antigen n=1 Tax=Caerostris extrusa TaxID=172846 RepID=A0AAV4RQ12_CAEEX|nr:large T antigen [Caerostris extrusa]